MHPHQTAMAGLHRPPESSPLWAKLTGRSPNTSSYPQECSAECCLPSACPLRPQTLQPRPVHLHQIAMAGLRRSLRCSLLWADLQVGERPCLESSSTTTIAPCRICVHIHFAVAMDGLPQPIVKCVTGQSRRTSISCSLEEVVIGA